MLNAMLDNMFKPMAMLKPMVFDSINSRGTAGITISAFIGGRPAVGGGSVQLVLGWFRDQKRDKGNEWMRI